MAVHAKRPGLLAGASTREFGCGYSIRSVFALMSKMTMTSSKMIR